MVIREAVRLGEYCVLLQIVAQAGLSGQAYCDDESATCQIHTPISVFRVVYHEDISTLVNRNEN